MYRLKLEVLTVIAAWAFTVASSPSTGCNDLDGRDDDLKVLGAKLSSTAKIYYPGSRGFKNVTTRWSVLKEPKVNIVVVPGTEDDVAETVSFDMPISRFTIAQVDC
jgi:predicted small secreted protein